MAKAWNGQDITLSDPTDDLQAVEPGEITRPKWLRVGGAGDLVVKFSPTGDDVTIKGVAAGEYLPIRPIEISEDTTCTDILAAY